MDTSSFQSVKDFSDWYKSKFNHLHILANNAGIHYASVVPSPLDDLKMEAKSPDGYDLAFATNYLGHFLLTRLLLPLMFETETKTGKSGRIVSVSSSYHFQSDGTMLASKDGDDPEAAKAYVGNYNHRKRAYANNKLAQVLHMKELQRRIDAGEFGQTKTLKVFSFCPSLASTSILPDNAGGNFVSRRAFKPKVAILAVLVPILNTQFLSGGNFVTIYKNTPAWWKRPLLKLTTKLQIRDTVVDVLSMYILIYQNAHYGVHDTRTTDEGDDEVLAKSLYDWSQTATSKHAS